MERVIKILREQEYGVKWRGTVRERDRQREIESESDRESEQNVVSDVSLQYRIYYLQRSIVKCYLTDLFINITRYTTK